MDRKGLFEEARSALRDLEAALISATDCGIEEGRFIVRRGYLAAELRWPYEGWIGGNNGKLDLRLYIEANLPATEVAPLPSDDNSARDGDGFA